MEEILQLFPDLTPRQTGQFRELEPLYRDWNQKINVISRKDIDNLYPHHVLHSLAIARIIRFQPGARILDLGTGGGFPGIPLAILFPETQFTLIDGTRKKITVVEAVRAQLRLENVTARHLRAEEVREMFDFVVSRAVATLDKLATWSLPLIDRRTHRHAIPNGLIALKGGDVQSEIRALPRGSYAEVYPLSDFFPGEYFVEKYALYLQA